MCDVTSSVEIDKNVHSSIQSNAKQEPIDMDPLAINESCHSPGNLEKLTRVTSNPKVVINTTRFTRSRDNPDFVAKQKSFMAQVQAANSGSPSVTSNNTRSDPTPKRRRESTASPQITKRKKIHIPDAAPQNSQQNDNACWDCHKEGQFICCEMCPRSFHLKCVGLEKEPEEDWACKECHSIMLAEKSENRSRAMQLITVDQFGVLLKHALKRFKVSPVLVPFQNPVDIVEFPTYKDIVQHPVDLKSLEENIGKKFYGSTEAFLADAKWIVHNSVLFNGANSKITSLARSMIKTLKQELGEIETCPDCYLNAHQHPQTWFIEACRLAHPLVWARLKGFPYWPAKAVKYKEGLVDVRFFGRHDRSWIPVKDCYLYSEQMPVPAKAKNKTLENCIAEVTEHIEKLKAKFGTFKAAPHRTPFNPLDPEQIKLLLPGYEGPPILKLRPTVRSLSTISGQSGTDDDASSIASCDSTASINRKPKSRRDSLLASSPISDAENFAEPHTKDEKTLPDLATGDPEQELVLEQSDISPLIISNVETLSGSNSLENSRNPTPECVAEEQDSSGDAIETKVVKDEPKVESNDVTISPKKVEIDQCKNELEEADAAVPPDGEISPVKDEVEEDLSLKQEEREPPEHTPLLEEDTSLAENESFSLNLTDDHDEMETEVFDDSESLPDLTREDHPDKEAKTIDEKEDVDQIIEEQEKDTSEITPSQDQDTKHNQSLEEINPDHTEEEVTPGETEDFEGTIEEDLEEQTEDEEEATLRNECAKDSLLVSSEDEEDLMIDEGPEVPVDDSPEKITPVEDKESNSVDENIRNLEKLNALLRASDEKPDSPAAEETGLKTENNVSIESKAPATTSAVNSEKGQSNEDDFAGFSIEDVHKSAESVQKVIEQVDSLSKNKNLTVKTSFKKSDTTKEKEPRPKQSLSIKKLASSSHVTSETPTDAQDSRGSPDKPLSEELQELANANAADFPAIAGKMFHNITITSNKKISEKKPDVKKIDEGEAKKSDSLSEAARIVKNFGNIAVKRLDNKTLEHTTGNDKVTISVANEPAEAPKPLRKKVRRVSSSSTGSNASSVAKSEDDSVKMPSGVDTTRLSPSISITAVGNNSFPEKIKRSPSFGSPPTTPQTSAPPLTPVSSSIPTSSVPVIPPPPLLSNTSMSQAGNLRFFNPQVPGMQPPRTSIAPSGLRMLAANPALMLQNRLPANVLRHLPPDAGPLSAELSKQSVKLAEIMRITIEELLSTLCSSGNLEAKMSALQLELERSNWRHQQELADMRHSADLLLVEMRSSMEAEKQRSVEEVRKQMDQKVTEVRRQYELKLNERITEVKRQAEREKQQEVEETKKKQWCAVCNKEALFFCCWNTSYCDYPCQQAHWPQHMTVCAQNNSNSNGGTNNQDQSSDNINGDVSTPSSRVSTPIQNIGQGFQSTEDDDTRLLDERRRKRKRENPSPLFSDSLGREQSPGNLAGISNSNSSPLPVTSPLGSSQVRPLISPGLNLGMLTGGGSNQNMQMKLQRFLQPNMMQAQQPFFAAMDPRMMMMLGRNIPGSGMVRGPMQTFRPRYM